MPIYEYQCDKCGEFEVMQRITEAPLKKCPTCKSKVRKLMSNTSFQLKGSGWYVTDYARSGSGGSKEDKSEKASGGDSSASGESSSEKKSEKKKPEKAEAKGKKAAA